MEQTIKLLSVVLGAVALMAIATSIGNLFSAMTDKRVLRALHLNGSRNIIVSMNIRNGISRLLFAVGKLLTALIAFHVNVIDYYAQVGESIVLVLLTINSLMLTINYLFDERDRRMVLLNDEISNRAKETQGADTNPVS